MPRGGCDMRTTILALAILCVGGIAGMHPISVDAAEAEPQWLVGWGSGDVVSSVQPGTKTGCDAAHSCEETVEGSGTTRLLTVGAGAAAGFDFVAVVTVDLPGATPNGAGGTCFPASGVISLTGAAAGQGTLVLDIEGSDCALGGSTTRRVLTGTFVVDGAASSGTATAPSGVGAFNWTADSSVAPTAVTMSFSGCVTGLPGDLLDPSTASITPAKITC
jgi:hypothetical protein